jgi:hypothetical protein
MRLCIQAKSPVGTLRVRTVLRNGRIAQESRMSFNETDVIVLSVWAGSYEPNAAEMTFSLILVVAPLATVASCPTIAIV